jgi:hypothetical protein
VLHYSWRGRFSLNLFITHSSCRRAVGEEMHVAVRQAVAGQHVRDALLVVAAPDPSIPLDCKGV